MLNVFYLFLKNCFTDIAVIIFFQLFDRTQRNFGSLVWHYDDHKDEGTHSFHYKCFNGIK